MTIRLAPDTKTNVLESVKRFFDEQLDHEIGDLKAELVLDYVLREIAPSVYNQAIRDAQAWFQERVGDVEGSCHEPELGYWSPR